MRTLEESLAGLLEPRLLEMGLEMVDLELSRQGGRLWVRLFVDRVDQSQGGVSAAECGEVNLLASRLLDVAELIPESYLLEVSSPGLNRRLRKLKDFEKHLGRTVNVAAKEAVAGRKKFRGKLVAADAEGITVEVGGESYRVPHGAMARATLEYDFEGRGIKA